MKSGKNYLVDVEAYEKHIYGIKFYLKSQAHLQEKYSFQTNDFEPRRIVLSCIYIMKHYYETDLIHNKRTMKRNYILALIMFIIGVLVFSLMFILDHFFANSLGLWKEVIDVVAWVFIWESVDIAFIEKIENSNLIKISNNIINSKIIFSKMINWLIFFLFLYII